MYLEISDDALTCCDINLSLSLLAVDENPLERAAKTATTNLFQTPIDEIDAAARLLDPIFTGINNPNAPKDYGKFLKDYKETEW